MLEILGKKFDTDLLKLKLKKLRIHLSVQFEKIANAFQKSKNLSAISKKSIYGLDIHYNCPNNMVHIFDG